MIPAEAGIQSFQGILDSRLRGSEGNVEFFRIPVEDNHFFREAFRTSFHERIPSAVIEEAGNGEEALQRINGIPPDLIFTDMRLAGISGLELAQKVKKGFPRIRIAMLTAYDFPEYRRVASLHGVDRFFVKDSLDWKELKEFVQGVPRANR